MAVKRKRQLNLETVLVFLLIYCSGSTVLFGTSVLSVVITAIIPDIIFFIIFLFLFLKRGQIINPTYLALYGIIVLFLGIMMVCNHDFSLNNIYEIMQVSLGFLAVTLFNQQRFEKSFYYTIMVLCCFSLVTYLVTIVWPSIINVFPTIDNTAGLSFHHLGLSAVPHQYLGARVVRNFGIFREPGVFVCFIGLAYILGKKNGCINLFSNIVFVATLVSTLSTTGYVVLVLILVSILLEKKSVSRSVIYIAIVALFVGTLKLYTNFLDADGPVFAKLFVHTSSYNARLGSFTQNIELIKMYPFVGAGWENSKAFFLSNTISVHDTNTYLFYFSCYGLIVGFLYTAGLLKTFTIKRKPIISMLMILIAFVSLSSERVCFDITLLTMIFYGLKHLLTKSNRGCNNDYPLAMQQKSFRPKY